MTFEVFREGHVPECETSRNAGHLQRHSGIGSRAGRRSRRRRTSPCSRQWPEKTKATENGRASCLRRKPHASSSSRAFAITASPRQKAAERLGMTCARLAARQCRDRSWQSASTCSCLAASRTPTCCRCASRLVRHGVAVGVHAAPGRPGSERHRRRKLCRQSARVRGQPGSRGDAAR